MGGVSIWHWIVVGVVVLLLFGRGKVSELMGDVAKGIKAFKKGMSEDETAAAAPTAPPKPVEDQRPAAAAPAQPQAAHAHTAHPHAHAPSPEHKAS